MLNILIKSLTSFLLLLTIGIANSANTAPEFDLGQFVTIPGGTYVIGSPENEPFREASERLHSVKLSPYSIMDAAVTQESYATVMGENPSGFKNPKYCPLSFKEIEVNGKKIAVCADHPVEEVSWDDANKFANRLNELDPKHKYDLPTEAQLEVAFRGGTNTAFVTGPYTSRDDMANLKKYVWYVENSNNQTHPVKSTQKNAFGFYRSSVWEWVRDWQAFKYEYAGSEGLDPKGPEGPDTSRGRYPARVVRGCAFASPFTSCRSAYRYFASPDARGNYMGFRLVRTLK